MSFIKWENAEKGGFGDRWEPTLLSPEEADIEYQKALNNCYQAREEAYAVETDGLKIQIQSDELLGKDTTVLKAQFAAKYEEIKLRYPKPDRLAYGIV